MSYEQYNPPKRKHWLIVITMGLALFQAGAAVRVLRLPAEIAAQTNLALPLEIAVSLFWAAFAVVVCRRLWQRRADAVRKAGWLTGTFSLYSVARLVIYAQADYDRGRLPFLALGLACIFLVLSGTRMRSSQKQFTEM